MVNIDNIKIQIRKLHHSKFKIVYSNAIKIKKLENRRLNPGCSEILSPLKPLRHKNSRFSTIKPNIYIMHR